MPVNFEALEECAFQGTLRDLKNFAEEHQGEEFYGAIFWCESVEIFTYMPTEELLRSEGTQIHQCNYEHLAGKSVDELMEEGRWNATQYMASDHIAWDDYELQIRQVTEDDEQSEGFADRYLELLCRVGLRIERSGVLDAFRRTPDFRIVCISSDHDFATCEQTLARVQESFPR